MNTSSYKDLKVWQKGIDLVDQVYQIVNKLPKHELYILGSQMIRAAISIPSNIAEGSRRSHKAEYIQFLSIAIASASELETQLIIAKRQYPDVSYTEAESLINDIHPMLYKLISSIRNG